MKKNQTNNTFPMSFSGEDTLIITPGEDWKKLLREEIKKLNADSNTVVVTDSYLFQEDDSTKDYRKELADILKTLNAKKIIITTDSDHGPKSIRYYVKKELERAGVTVELKKAKIHDRYWFCLESEKLLLATSPNVLGKKTSTLFYLPKEDFDKLKEDLINQGVIDDVKRDTNADNE